jgi:uncharacterized protein
LVGMKGDLHVPVCVNSCCEGQGTRLLGSLPEYIFSPSSDGLYVNLFEPSSIEWLQAGVKMKATIVGDFPFSPDVALTITASLPVRAKIRIRVPSWATGPMELHLSGENAVIGQPGTYMTLDRTWSSGDTVRFTLPMGFKLTRYTGLDQIEGHERFALEYGPVLLALVPSDSAVLTVKGTRHEEILSRIHEDPLRSLHFNIDGHPEFTYVPYWQVPGQPFTCYPVIDLT